MGLNESVYSISSREKKLAYLSNIKKTRLVLVRKRALNRLGYGKLIIDISGTITGDSLKPLIPPWPLNAPRGSKMVFSINMHNRLQIQLNCNILSRPSISSEIFFYSYAPKRYDLLSFFSFFIRPCVQHAGQCWLFYCARLWGRAYTCRWIQKTNL